MVVASEGTLFSDPAILTVTGAAIDPGVREQTTLLEVFTNPVTSMIETIFIT